MNRCYELERSEANHKKGLGVRVSNCSNVVNKYYKSNSKDPEVKDGNIPMHYTRARNKSRKTIEGR